MEPVRFVPLAAGGVLGMPRPYENSRGARIPASLVKYDVTGQELVQEALGNGVSSSGFFSVDAQQRVLTVTTAFDGSTSMSVCRRHTSDGTADSSFGGSGCSHITGLPLAHASGVISLPSGGALAGSPSYLVQLTASGARAPQFGTDGVFLLEPGDSVDSFLAQSDGHILVSLRAWNNAAQRKLIRLTPSGALDPSFANAGTLPDMGGPILVRADDTFLHLRAKSIAAYLPDGTPDEGFGTNGTVNLQEATGIDADQFGTRGFTQDASGRIYVTAVFTKEGRDGGLVARLTPTGAFDPEFHVRDASGAPITSVGSTLTVGADGKIWVMLSVGEGDSVRAGLALLLP
ncbi:delta-60 repeat domain-containing protein [Myxococcus sp. AM011]|uniref:delta-60 repeat domain-containing protein n=1 Tax=Myxococcus sp. AM011 TaxID=2745200 RepID=UPI001595484B|nr:delta-60 repeat domain-containing protein [Myxococcus sp. AM011]